MFSALTEDWPSSPLPFGIQIFHSVLLYHLVNSPQFLSYRPLHVHVDLRRTQILSGPANLELSLLAPVLSFSPLHWFYHTVPMTCFFGT